MLYDINKLSALEVYKIVSNSVVPRPIAWVSTISKDNILNIAPFSYFIPLSSNPATLLISIGHKKDGSPKDTLQNLRDTKRCSIVIAQTNELNSMHNSSASLSANESEFEKFNIESKEILKDYPKIPKSAKVAFFCKYLKEVELKDSKTIPVIVQIENVFVDESLFTSKEELKIKLDPIARVGAKYYKLGVELNPDIID